jgi:hypothetical protein
MDMQARLQAWRRIEVGFAGQVFKKEGGAANADGGAGRLQRELVLAALAEDAGDRAQPALDQRKDGTVGFGLSAANENWSMTTLEPGFRVNSLLSMKRTSAYAPAPVVSVSPLSTSDLACKGLTAPDADRALIAPLACTTTPATCEADAREAPAHSSSAAMKRASATSVRYCVCLRCMPVCSRSETASIPHTAPLT